MVGPGRGALSPQALAAALDYIRATPQIWEVILTGGDPLVLSPRRLKDVMTRLAAIAHVKVIRVHTRMPVAAPERVSAALVRALRDRQGDFRRAARQSSARTVQSRARRLRAPRRCRHPDAVADGAVARRQRRCRDACGADAGAGRVPDQTLLPASRRSGARHRAFAHHHRARPGSDTGAARPHLRAVPADLCARHSRRLRQIADRTKLSEPRTVPRSRTSMAAGTAIRRSRTVLRRRDLYAQSLLCEA